MSLVLDGSATLAWIYAEETTEAIRRLFDRVAETGATVPAVWRLEIANSLAVGARRGRIAAGRGGAALADLAVLDIRVDPDGDAHAWGATFELAARFQLTLYDSAYLELAERRALPLVTLGRALRRAAALLGVGLLGMDGQLRGPPGRDLLTVRDGAVALQFALPPQGALRAAR